MKKSFLLITFLIVSLHSSAAQVRLDMIDFKGYGNDFYSIECLDYYSPWVFQVFFDFESGAWGNDWCFTPKYVDGPSGKGGVVMYEAAIGSVVNHDTAQQATYFVNAHGGYMNAINAEEPWTPLSGSEYRDIYWAIILTDYEGNEVFGWVGLSLTGYAGEAFLYGWQSAIDLDGGPMIVGGGAWEGDTPEPASGLLLLVGASLLALRRRRGLL